MKSKTVFRIREKGTPKTLYRLICRLVPSDVDICEVRVQACAGDMLRLAKIATLVAMCRTAGLSRSEHGGTGSYGYVVIREYEDCDLQHSELLCLHCTGVTIQDELKRDKQERLIILARNMEKLISFGQVGDAIVVSPQTREAMEQAHFHGLIFRHVGIYGRQAAASVQPCWELDSDLTMPKLANTDKLMCYGVTEAQPFNDDYSRMVFINDPPFGSGEMHYKRSDLLVMGQFDAARTFERIWRPTQTLVISERLYQFLRAQDVPITADPVRIDPD